MIFGKDQGTGAGAETVSEATAMFRSNLVGGSECDESDSHAGYDEVDPIDSNVQDEDPLVDPQAPELSDKQTSVAKTGVIKRKSTTSDAMLMDFLANLHVETNTRLEVISSRIEYDFDIGHARHAVFEKLGDVEGLTLDQRYQLCNILGDKPQRLEVFMGMSAEAHLGYLVKLMDE